MKDFMVKYRYYFLVAIIFSLIGYYVGQKTITYESEVEWVDTPNITVSPDIPKPIVSIPTNPKLPDDVLPNRKNAPAALPSGISDDYASFLELQVAQKSDSLKTLRNASKKVVSILQDSLEIYRNVLADYVKVKSYNIPSLDSDTLGKVIARPKVQFNRLIDFDLDFQLKQKVVTNYKYPDWRLSAGLGYNSIYDGVGIIDIGVERRKWGFNGTFIARPDMKYKGYGGTLRYYFK